MHEREGMSVRETLVYHIRENASENGTQLGDLPDNAAFLDSGLDSFEIAIRVTRLEETLGFDPFTQSDVFYSVTVGDFIRSYENASGAAAADSRQAS
jgi:hypothetical protein